MEREIWKSSPVMVGLKRMRKGRSLAVLNILVYNDQVLTGGSLSDVELWKAGVGADGEDHKGTLLGA